jgi:hypothetical protein
MDRRRASSEEIQVNENRVICQPVEKEGLVGMLFSPITPGPYPTVFFFGGAEALAE